LDSENDKQQASVLKNHNSIKIQVAVILLKVNLTVFIIQGVLLIAPQHPRKATRNVKHPAEIKTIAAISAWSS